jgi:hypothetical protein
MSTEFTNRKGLTAAWTTIRGDILEAHGMRRDRKHVNVQAGLIVMDLWLGERWVAYTDDRSSMCDRVDQGGTFRLRTVDQRVRALGGLEGGSCRR